MTKEEFELYKDKLIILNEKNILNDFQTLLINDIFYWTNTVGYYTYIEKNIHKKYLDRYSIETIENEIKELIDLKMISINLKRKIFNGNFITEKQIILSEWFKSIDEIDKFLKNLFD